MSDLERFRKGKNQYYSMALDSLESAGHQELADLIREFNQEMLKGTYQETEISEHTLIETGVSCEGGLGIFSVLSGLLSVVPEEEEDEEPTAHQKAQDILQKFDETPEGKGDKFVRAIPVEGSDKVKLVLDSKLKMDYPPRQEEEVFLGKDGTVYPPPEKDPFLERKPFLGKGKADIGYPPKGNDQQAAEQEMIRQEIEQEGKYCRDKLDQAVNRFAEEHQNHLPDADQMMRIKEEVALDYLIEKLEPESFREEWEKYQEDPEEWVGQHHFLGGGLKIRNILRTAGLEWAVLEEHWPEYFEKAARKAFEKKEEDLYNRLGVVRDGEVFLKQLTPQEVADQVFDVGKLVLQEGEQKAIESLFNSIATEGPEYLPNDLRYLEYYRSDPLRWFNPQISLDQEFRESVKERLRSTKLLSEQQIDQNWDFYFFTATRKVILTYPFEPDGEVWHTGLSEAGPGPGERRLLSLRRGESLAYLEGVIDQDKLLAYLSEYKKNPCPWVSKAKDKEGQTAKQLLLESRLLTEGDISRNWPVYLIEAAERTAVEKGLPRGVAHYIQIWDKEDLKAFLEDQKNELDSLEAKLDSTKKITHKADHPTLNQQKKEAQQKRTELEELLESLERESEPLVSSIKKRDSLLPTAPTITDKHYSAFAEQVLEIYSLDEIRAMKKEFDGYPLAWTMRHQPDLGAKVKEILSDCGVDKEAAEGYWASYLFGVLDSKQGKISEREGSEQLYEEGLRKALGDEERKPKKKKGWLKTTSLVLALAGVLGGLYFVEKGEKETKKKVNEAIRILEGKEVMEEAAPQPIQKTSKDKNKEKIVNLVKRIYADDFRIGFRYPVVYHLYDRLRKEDRLSLLERYLLEGKAEETTEVPYWLGKKPGEKIKIGLTSFRFGIPATDFSMFKGSVKRDSLDKLFDHLPNPRELATSVYIEGLERLAQEKSGHETHHLTLTVPKNLAPGVYRLVFNTHEKSTNCAGKDEYCRLSFKRKTVPLVVGKIDTQKQFFIREFVSEDDNGRLGIFIEDREGSSSEIHPIKLSFPELKADYYTQHRIGAGDKVKFGGAFHHTFTDSLKDDYGLKPLTSYRLRLKMEVQDLKGKTISLAQKPFSVYYHNQNTKFSEAVNFGLPLEQPQSKKEGESSVFVDIQKGDYYSIKLGSKTYSLFWDQKGLFLGDQNLNNLVMAALCAAKGKSTIPFKLDNLEVKMACREYPINSGTFTSREPKETFTLHFSYKNKKR